MEKGAALMECRLRAQGATSGSCKVRVGKRSLPACFATLTEEKGRPMRLIHAVHLSRPENYLSVYQSGCNFSCRKCHSWSFSQVAEGTWYGPEDVLKEAISYERAVTLVEPRERATAWHAHESCRCCGWCVLYGKRSPRCPRVLDTKQVVMSPQGFGPARNILAFTGGDLTCCPEFYGQCAMGVKEATGLWVIIETNGWGLTGENLNYLKRCGVDGFWLDIKALDPKRHLWLTGCPNDRILSLPEEILKRGFVLEVLSLYIPGLVEAEEIGRIARLLSSVDPDIPFTILAFFPEYLMKDHRPPTAQEMAVAYDEAIKAGLRKVRLGNLGVFVKEELEWLMERVDPGAL